MSACATSSGGLAGSEWGPANAPNTFIQFKQDGVASGSGGCNGFSGSYEVSGNSLKFSPLASTKRGCVGEVMEQEIAFFNALSKVASFELNQEKKELVLMSSDGQELARLKQRDWD